MKYTVYLELSFENKEDAIDLLNVVEKIKEKAYKPIATDMQPLEIKTELWETHHDEDPPKQCSVIDSVDFEKADIAVHK